ATEGDEDRATERARVNEVIDVDRTGHRGAESQGGGVGAVEEVGIADVLPDDAGHAGAQADIGGAEDAARARTHDHALVGGGIAQGIDGNWRASQVAICSGPLASSCAPREVA